MKDIAKMLEKMRSPLTFNKPIGKHHHIECTSLFQSRAPLRLGAHFMIHRRGLHLRLGALILMVEVDIMWKGDHPGFFLMVDTPWVELLDFEFYDIRHEKIIDKKESI